LQGKRTVLISIQYNRAMKYTYTLTLHEERAGSVVKSGEVIPCYVGGMPTGEDAKIANHGTHDENDWRIMRIKGENQSEWIGHYKTAEEALAWLQSKIDAETL
jgi:hypothetical protein